MTNNLATTRQVFRKIIYVKCVLFYFLISFSSWYEYSSYFKGRNFRGRKLRESKKSRNVGNKLSRMTFFEIFREIKRPFLKYSRDLTFANGLCKDFSRFCQKTANSRKFLPNSRKLISSYTTSLTAINELIKFNKLYSVRVIYGGVLVRICN